MKVHEGLYGDSEIDIDIYFVVFQRHLGASMAFSFALPSLSCDAQIG